MRNQFAIRPTHPVDLVLLSPALSGPPAARSDASGTASAAHALQTLAPLHLHCNGRHIRRRSGGQGAHVAASASRLGGRRCHRGGGRGGREEVARMARGQRVQAGGAGAQGGQHHRAEGRAHKARRRGDQGQGSRLRGPCRCHRTHCECYFSEFFIGFSF
jgi:hypothetical protein